MSKKSKRKVAVTSPPVSRIPYTSNRKIKLFAYGTLNVHSVQRSIWGESMQGVPAQLRNYELKLWPGSAIFYIERKPGEVVTGKYYELTEEQIKNTDIYESEAYSRVTVLTEGKDSVQTYIRADGGEL